MTILRNVNDVSALDKQQNQHLTDRALKFSTQ